LCNKNRVDRLFNFLGISIRYAINNATVTDESGMITSNINQSCRCIRLAIKLSITLDVYSKMIS
jgi:hypothetical protein